MGPLEIHQQDSIVERSYEEKKRFYLEFPSSETFFPFLVCVCLMACPLDSLAQFQRKIDSLQTLLVAKAGKDRCDLYYQMAYEAIDNDNRLAQKFANSSFLLARELNDDIRIVSNGRLLASALRRLGALDSALFIYELIIPLAEKKGYKDELRILYNASGVTYMYNGQYGQGLKCHLLSLRLNEEVRDSSMVSAALNNIGLIYYKLKNHQKARQYFAKCLSTAMLLKNSYFIQTSSLNIANTLAADNKLDTARIVLDFSKTYCQGKCGERFYMESKFVEGVIHFKTNCFEDAVNCFESSYRASLILKDDRYQLDNLAYLARVSIAENKAGLALSILRKSEKIIAQKSSFSLEALNCYLQFCKAYDLVKDYKSQVSYYQKYNSLRERVFNEEMIAALMQLEGEYMERENLQQISSQGQVISLKTEIINRQTITNMLMLVIVALLSILILLLFRSVQNKKNLNMQLEKCVQKRTLELSKSRNMVVTMSAGMEQRIEKASGQLTDAISRMNALSQLALNDINDERQREYVHYFKMISRQLEGTRKALTNNRHLV